MIVFVIFCCLILLTLVQRIALLLSLENKRPDIYEQLGKPNPVMGWNFFLVDLLLKKFRPNLEPAQKTKAICMAFTWSLEIISFLVLVGTTV